MMIKDSLSVSNHAIALLLIIIIVSLIYLAIPKEGYVLNKEIVPSTEYYKVTRQLDLSVKHELVKTEVQYNITFRITFLGEDTLYTSNVSKETYNVVKVGDWFSAGCLCVPEFEGEDG